MATAIWPPVLPQTPQRNGWKDSAPNDLIRTDMDTGTSKARRRGGDNQWKMHGYVCIDQRTARYAAHVHP